MTRFLLLILLATPAHADGGISGVIGGIISAMQPTSASPDTTSQTDDGDDD